MTYSYCTVNKLLISLINSWTMIPKGSMSKRTIPFVLQEFLVTFEVKTSEKMLGCLSRSNSGGKFLTFRNRTKNVEKFLSD